MNKKIKLILVVGLIGVGIFLVNVAVWAATAECIDTHAGFCGVLGLGTGDSMEIGFDEAKEKLEAYYDKHSGILGYSYMEYSGGYWYWRCGNMNVIRFTDVCDENDWGDYGNCSVACGGGVQYRYNDCGDSQSRSCNDFACPECGSANEESYERTSELTLPDIRCATENIMSNWLDQSEFATAPGIAWTWRCNRNSLDVPCLAYKMGECVDPDPTVGPYNSRNDACRFGAFNSVRLGTDDILRWQCGTGTSAKHIGSFISNDSGSGALVAVDYYGPREGGVECQCTPSYQYECIATNAYVNNETCINRCGENIVQIYQAVKTDTACFPNEALPTDKAEYLQEKGVICSNESVSCPPCGTQEGEGGSHHESN